MNRSLGIALLAISLFTLYSLPTRVSAATAYIVSGMVTAPGGVIASRDQAEGMSLARVLDFFIAPAEAKLSGLLPVPNGTSVELVRVTDTGRMSAPIATATVQYGRYRFNLSALRRTVSSRLLVRVDNVATGAQMRAFVTDKTVNINPVSETAVRMALDTVASSQDGTLDNFTVTELEDLNGSLDLLTSVNKLPADADIESSVQDIRDAVAGNAGIRAFLTASARPGQTNTGPGDIGNFFPFTKGLSWTYRVRNTEDGIASAPYTNTVLTNGTRVINGVTTTVFRNSNPDGDGVAENDFSKKTSSGLYDWEVVRDGDSNKPFRFMRFPAAPGSVFTQSLNDMGFNEDIDRDGIVERFTLTMTTTVARLGTVSVPAGNLPNTLEIRSTLTGGATVSSTRKRIALTATAVEWYTQNLGLSKQTLSYRATYDGRVWKDTRTSELTEANGFPLTGEFPLDRWTTLNIESTDIVYDSVSERFFASIPSHASTHADSVVVINPYSARVEATIPVGNNPGPLAISDNGQFLYVGLNGDSGAVLQVALPTLTIGPEWPISRESGGITRLPYDIEVQPGSPEVIAVSTSDSELWRRGGSYMGTVILDSGIERPTSITDWSGPDHIMFSDDPSVVYGYNFIHEIQILSVTDDGIALVGKTDYLSSGWDNSKYAAGRMFTRYGTVFDTVAWTVLGRYSSRYSGAKFIELDAQTQRAALLTRSTPRSHLEVFDLDSYVELDEASFPTATSDYPTDLLGFGSDGYAVRVVDTSTDLQRARLILVRPASSN